MRLVSVFLRVNAGVMFDVVLVAWMTWVTEYFVGHWPDPADLWRNIDPLGRLLLAAVHLPLIARRRWPVGSFTVSYLAGAVYLTLAYYHSVITFGAVLALYSVASYRPRRVSLVCMGLVVALFLWAARLAEPGMHGVSAAIAVMISVIAWFFGDGTRRLAERGASLRILADRLRYEQEERARQAVANEQSRIAQELHDVVAHHMSVIAVQAGSGRYLLDADPTAARSALRVIEATAADSLGAMRRMLTVLRHYPPDADGQRDLLDANAGLSGLPDLFQRVRAAGATVREVVTGAPASLAKGPQLCVYRIIQEALTNVIKHARPPVATVGLHWCADTLTVRVTDEGAPTEPGAVRPAGDAGFGLVGMHERARIYGGTLTAGPIGTGFEVTLVLPLAR